MTKNTQKSCLSPNEIEAKLQAAGIQPTAQRVAICRYVLCEACHPTAEDVKTWADKNFPKISLATVYNTLGVLVRAGLLREFRFPHSDKIFYDQNVENHFHFLDESSGTVMDLSPEDVEVSLKMGGRFQVRDVDVVIRGTLG